MQIELSLETITTLLTWHRQMEMAMVSKGLPDTPEKRFMAAAKEFQDKVSEAETMKDHKKIVELMKFQLTEMG